MHVLGLSCGFGTELEEMGEGWPVTFSHDSAVAVVRDGVALAAVEEERLNRLKHTNKFPHLGLPAVLDAAGLKPHDLDRVAFFWSEGDFDTDLDLEYCERPLQPRRHTRELILEGLSCTLGVELGPDRLRFVPHHSSHASAAYFNSGFQDALVVVMDGEGEHESLSVMSASGRRLETVRTFGVSKSLGHLYSTAIQLLGYGPFDEYKVMGLAPYGDPSRYRDDFQQLYELTPDGGYDLDYSKVLVHFIRKGFAPHRKGEPFSHDHRDFAAALQETLETIVLHVIKSAQRSTGHRRLCLGGGVALNCTMNGLIRRSLDLDGMFVDPAAHDAGTAVGAAQFVCALEEPDRFAAARLEHVYLGPSVGDQASLGDVLRRWERQVRFERASDPAREAAALLADGKIIGWVQGRSEFGPRALGNRSILADPRPAENRDRINAVVKRRESYRPFAPSVIAERAADFFDCPPGIALRFMVASVPVAPQARAVLQAVTHVDGSARVHVVERETNPAYWRLITAFGELTGVPVVLNTSFNNEVEPVVQTAEDALACFLTTRLDALVLGPFVVTRRDGGEPDLSAMTLTLPPQVRLEWTRDRHKRGANAGAFALRYQLTRGRQAPISHDLGTRLQHAALPVAVEDILCDRGQTGALTREILDLWSRRFVILRPR